MLDRVKGGETRHERHGRTLQCDGVEDDADIMLGGSDKVQAALQVDPLVLAADDVDFRGVAIVEQDRLRSLVSTLFHWNCHAP